MPVDANGCLEYPTGAVIKNSWACRSCVQVFVDLVISQGDLATFGSLENMYVEVWFDSVTVEHQQNWYPVASTEAASANNGIKFNFDPIHKWPATGVIQFDSQLRYAGENPSISGVRVCPIDSDFTTTPAAETTTTPATTPGTTLPVKPIPAGCFEVNGATIKNTWACRSCIQLYTDFQLDQSQIARVSIIL